VNNTSIAAIGPTVSASPAATNVTVQGNLIDSVAANSGMEVSVFGNTGRPLDSAWSRENIIIRGGGWNGSQYGMHVGSPSSTSYFFQCLYERDNFQQHCSPCPPRRLRIGAVHEL